MEYKVVLIQTRYLCQLTSAGYNDIDDSDSSCRTCITAGNVLGETCPLSAHQFFSNLLSPHSPVYSCVSPLLSLLYLRWLFVSRHSKVTSSQRKGVMHTYASGNFLEEASIRSLRNFWDGCGLLEPNM